MKKQLTVARVLQVLTFFAERSGSWGVRELARQFELPHSTMHRLLQALQSCRFLSLEGATRKYGIGPEFYRVALLVAKRFDLAKLAMPVLEELARRSSGSVFLSVYSPETHTIVFVAAVESSHALWHVPELYVHLPVYAGASGRSILAFLPEDEIRRIVDNARLEPITPYTITDRASLLKSLQVVRERGYAVSHQERLQEASAIAAPFWTREGRPGGSVVLVMPVYRFSPQKEIALAPAVMEAAASISRLLGATRVPSDKSLAGDNQEV